VPEAKGDVLTATAIAELLIQICDEARRGILESTTHGRAESVLVNKRGARGWVSRAVVIGHCEGEQGVALAVALTS
jgi:hypothetical protein